MISGIGCMLMPTHIQTCSGIGSTTPSLTAHCSSLLTSLPPCTHCTQDSWTLPIQPKPHRRTDDKLHMYHIFSLETVFLFSTHASSHTHTKPSTTPPHPHPTPQESWQQCGGGSGMTIPTRHQHEAMADPSSPSFPYLSAAAAPTGINPVSGRILPPFSSSPSYIS